MKYVALALIAAMATAGGAFAQDRVIHRYSLDNGLDVILVPDHRVPKVVVDMAFKVGAINEPAGRTGFAHLFEHLMFMGTPAYPDIDAAYGTVGAEINASTWHDYTLYYERGLSSSLPYILALEADRLANAGAAITQEDLDVQRDVVLNEIRQNVLDSVNGAAYQVAATMIYPPDHPYSRSAYGSIADLEAATIEDVHGFFDTFYVPNNAILTIVGDVEVEAAKELIEGTFGLIPRGADVPAPAPPPIAPQRARVELEDRVPTPRIILAWATEPLRSANNSRLRIIAELIGNPDYGVLRRALIDTGLADNAWAYLYQANHSGQFSIEISVAEGRDPAAAEAAARAALADFLATPLTEADVERERRKIVLGDRVVTEDPLILADNILTFAISADNPQLALDDDPHVLGATPENVLAAARVNLQPDDASTVLVRPGERGAYPALLTASSGAAEPFTAAPRPHVEIPMLAAAAPVPAAPPQRQTAVLGNGIRVIHYDMPKAPMAFLAASSISGTLSDPEGREMIELAAVMGTNGAGERGPIEFGKAATDLGASFSVQIDVGASLVNMSAPQESFAAAVDLLGDVLRRPRFEEAEWETTMARTLSALAERESDVVDVAGRHALAALLPKLPGYPAIDSTIASTRAVTREDAMAIYPRVFSPQTVTFHSVGPVPLAEVVAALEASFGDWTQETEPLPGGLSRPVAVPDGRRVLLVPEPGATQSAIHIATPAPGFDEPGSAEAFAVFRLLGEDFISRINAVIREEKGYTYHTDGKLLDFVRSGSAMVIEAPVKREHTGDALVEMFRAYASLATDPVRADEMERTVASIHADLAGTAETSQGLFDAIWENLVAGSTLEEQHERRLAITALELESLRAWAAEMSSLERALIVVVGDEAAVRPQLEAIGLVVEVVERDL